MRKPRIILLVCSFSLLLCYGCGSAVVAALLLLQPEHRKGRPAVSQNTPPSVIILPISGTQTGDVTVTYYLSDTDSNTAEIKVEFSADEGVSYITATEETVSGLSEGTTNLATSPTGVPHVFIWDTDADLSGIVNGNVLIRITPSDIDGIGTPAEISISLDNNRPPTVVVTTPSSPASGAVTVSYTLMDAEGDTCSIMVGYSTDGGLTFKSATEGSGSDGTSGLASSSTGVTHTYVWNSLADLGYANYSDVVLRITPSDIKTGAYMDTTFDVNNNEAPIAQVDTPTTAQSANVYITYKLFDSNSDLVDIEVQWWDPFDATPQWKVAREVAGAPSEGTTELTSSPGGTSHIFVWNSLTDMGQKYSDQIKVRIRPSDVLATGGWAESNPFAVSNNEAPTAMAQTPSGVQQSNVLITYYLSDAESDTCDITVYFSDDGGVNWKPATEVTGSGDGTTNLTSSPSPGTSHTFDWDAQTDLSGRYETDVQIKIVPADEYREGTAYPTSNFTVDATTPPSVSDITLPGGTPLSGDISIGYTLTDAESQDCSILVEYTNDGGLNWYTATEGAGGDGTSGLVSSPTGVSHTFVWDTVADNIGPSGVETVRIRITPSDTKTGATVESADFDVDNSAYSEKPWIVITTPSSPQSGTFDITYDLDDNQGDNCDIEVEFSTDGGRTWSACSGSPVTNTPVGTGKTFSWDSVTDIGNVYNENVRIRMRPTDSGGNVGNWAVTGNFTVDNNAAPWVEITTPTGTESGDVTINYTLYDDESDVCSIYVEFSDDGGVNWYPATEGTGGDGTSGLSSSSGGTSHTYVWDSSTDIGATSQDDIRIRITPNDGYRDGTPASTNNFTVNNIVTVTWTGNVDDNWEVEGNWDGGVPTPSSSVTIPSGRPYYPRLTYSTRIYSLSIMSGASLTLKGDITLSITSNATVSGTLVMDSTWTHTTLSVEGDLTVSGVITADGKGYASGSGFAPGENGDEGGAGAAHGGYGGFGEGWTYPKSPYDSVVEPQLPGSGGGSGNYGNSPGGAGGGAIRIIVSKTFTIEGTVTANGADGVNGGGGGSGGSIYINCDTLTGSGSFNADGGDGTGSPQGGGGGGGKIAIHYNDISGYTGTASCSAVGGTGFFSFYYMYGSIVFIDKNNTEDDRTDDDLYIYHNTHLNETFYRFRNVTITNDAEVAFNSFAADSSTCPQITLEATGDMRIDSGVLLTADALGYPGSEGPGAGSDDPQGLGTGGHGGGHGGYGGRGDNNEANPVGSPYGSLLEPTTSGSGGGNGDNYAGAMSGGGAIRLKVGGTLILDGEVSADGEGPSWQRDAGGGAGGSVWISCSTIQGSGFCTANGGSGNDDGGGGAGGRIAIYYADDTNYSGHIDCTASGGSAGGGVDQQPYGSGECGSCVFVDTKGNSDPTDDVIHIYTDCRITQNDLICAGLILHNDATFFCSSRAVGYTQILIYADYIEVPSGCAVSADGLGYLRSSGPGAGGDDNDGAGGAGYGGAGGDGLGASGGSTYGDPSRPTNCGSGGGSRDPNDDSRWGGRGGGSIKFNVTGTLVLEGRISADGENAPGSRSGGGAGGSIWIISNTLKGAGYISANGGNGKNNNRGGGGGGGRILINATDTTNWTGTAEARGGIGPGNAGEGGDGTVQGP